MKPWDLFQPWTRWIYQNTDFRNTLRAAGIEQLAALTSPQLGDLVTQHRSSWVRRVPLVAPGSTGEIYVKTYDYPTWSDRWSGFGRNTRFRASRVRREWQALTWLAEHGFAGPQVLAVVKQRQLGFLTRGALVTAAWPGESLDRLFPRLLAAPPDGSTELELTGLLHALRQFVTELHQAGFRDRNLDPRNILARRVGLGEECAWQFAKIDSPRFRLVAPGTREDHSAARDWQRLNRGLEQLGVDSALLATGPAR